MLGVSIKNCHQTIEEKFASQEFLNFIIVLLILKLLLLIILLIKYFNSHIKLSSLIMQWSRNFFKLYPVLSTEKGAPEGLPRDEIMSALTFKLSRSLKISGGLSRQTTGREPDRCELSRRCERPVAVDDFVTWRFVNVRPHQLQPFVCCRVANSLNGEYTLPSEIRNVACHFRSPFGFIRILDALNLVRLWK